MYGLRIKSGRHILWDNDLDESMYTDDCSIVLGAGGTWTLSNSAQSVATSRNTVVDLTLDGTTNRSASVFTAIASSLVNLEGITFVNALYRTGTIFTGATGGARVNVSGADFSGFTNATACEILNVAIAPQFVFTNCKTVSSPTFYSGTIVGSFESYLTNVGNADDPTALSYKNYFGDVLSSGSIYRTSGGTVESANTGWLVTTNASCVEAAPFYTPWIYGTVASTGSKTFDIYTTNDTADFTDAEVWIEIQYLATSDIATWTLASDHRTNITTSAAAQTDDVTSTWNGSGPSFTYMQKLSVAATIGETGQYRARVVVGKASIAGSAFFYVDPKVTVT
jgi:hypothetical protein